MDNSDRKMGGKNKAVLDDLKDLKNEECIICCEACKTFRLMLECKHLFCIECISEWSVNKSWCPLCKQPLTENNTIAVLNPQNSLTNPGFDWTMLSDDLLDHLTFIQTPFD